MGGFVIRVKTKSGQKIVDSLTPQDTVTTLKHKLSEITGVQTDSLHILRGFPPKALDLSNGNATLQDSNITSGETLIIEEKQTEVDNKNITHNAPREHIVESANIEDYRGVLMRMTVPADDSCLFTSINFVFTGKVDPSCSQFMRELVATSLEADPEQYTEAILGKPLKDYCEWIRLPNSWGGAIELSILSKHYGVEIDVVESSTGNIRRFGEDQNYAQRVFLVFDGIHYDPLYLEPIDGGKIQAIFLRDDDTIYKMAEEMAEETKSSHQYTDVNKFTLKCTICQIRLSGSEAAQKHAKETGHQSFGEIIS